MENFLDRADGELARLGHMMSAGGHRDDYYADTAVNSLFFVSIGIGLHQSWLGAWSIALGLISASAMLLCSRLARLRRGGRQGDLSFGG